MVGLVLLWSAVLVAVALLHFAVTTYAVSTLPTDGFRPSTVDTVIGALVLAGLCGQPSPVRRGLLGGRLGTSTSTCVLAPDFCHRPFPNWCFRARRRG